ncbi:MAG TPA: glutamate--tRNA ligase, partial [Gemmatimonadetes bacterium]|nr:glutamate--tRNA ligase [Gemmatimonadota bacterium]
LPMILGPDGGRLSKRHGATAVQEYEDQGILPEALFNFLALLGWNPGDDREVMSKDEIVAEFSLERVQKKSAVFDNKKLSWMNGQHLARVDSHDLVSLVIARFDARGVASDRWRGREGWLVRLVDLLKVRARNLDDLAAMAEPYLSGPVDYEADSVAKHWAKEPATVAERIAELRGRLDDTPWERGALNEVTRSVAEALEIPAGKLIHPVRVAVTGRQHSPGIFDVLEMLGKERTLARLDRALRHLHTMK